jgi:hypothetical protein
LSFINRNRAREGTPSAGLEPAPESTTDLIKRDDEIRNSLLTNAFRLNFVPRSIFNRVAHGVHLHGINNAIISAAQP